LLVEGLEVLLVLGDFLEELQALAHEVLADDLDDLRLLEHLAADVERQVLRVHDALHEAEPLRHEFLAVVHDENAAHVELHVVLLLVLEEVEWGTLRHVEQRTKSVGLS